MKYYRSLALAASLAAGLAQPAFAQPAFAQTAAPVATPASMPDAGVKKQAPAPIKHVRHVTHHKAAKPVTPPTTR